MYGYYEHQAHGLEQKNILFEMQQWWARGDCEFDLKVQLCANVVEQLVSWILVLSSN